MSYTLGEAARSTGKSKTTILRAIRSGKVSAEKTVNGTWLIEPAELHRIYPEAPPETVTTSKIGAPNNPQLQFETLLLEERLSSASERIKHLEQQVVDLKAREADLCGERDAWRDQATRKRLTWRGLFGGGKAE